MVTEAIILAGGLGTRLQEAVPDTPKCLAPVNGKPFIQYVMDHLCQQGIGRVILSLGYKHEPVVEYFETHQQKGTVVYSIENEPLGTGGAIRLALQHTTAKNILIVNGDTLCKADVQDLATKHEAYNAVCTLSLKPMNDFDRYGSVALEDDGRISLFREKTFREEGLINTGMYVIDTERFSKIYLPVKHSFEKDFLERYSAEGMVYGLVQDAYFIDIGVPEDYERASYELRVMS